VRLRLLSPAGAHDSPEDYEFSLPSVFARSILTVPWVELGDKVTIHCQQTGYSASVVFHTKVCCDEVFQNHNSVIRSYHLSLGITLFVKIALIIQLIFFSCTIKNELQIGLCQSVYRPHSCHCFTV